MLIMKTFFYTSPHNRAESSVFTQIHWLFILPIVFLLASCIKDVDEGKEEIIKVSVFSKGFNNPRGLKFGPDGALYVAEAGLGGDEKTTEGCPGATGEVFPGSPTGGRISKVSSSGMRTTVTDKLPTSGEGFFILGVSDVAFYE